MSRKLQAQPHSPKNNLASYISDGLKIYGLLTIPIGEKPKVGWPVIIFNHGYIPPNQYRTTERYISYVDGFARNGYIVFKSDYRGNGSSEGQPEGSYYSPAYSIDVLNAPVQLDVGLSDEEVPWQFSQGLNNRLLAAGKIVEYYTYPGADHNISGSSFEIAMQRSIDFFNKYLKAD